MAFVAQQGAVLVGVVRLGRLDHSTVNFGLGLNTAVRIYMHTGDRMESDTANDQDFKDILTIQTGNDVHAFRDFAVYSANATD
ncbi:MAG: hypothetical protein ABJH20_10805 [Rhizobiaceae bacterium]